MKKKITIVDYGSGNVFSVQQSFLKVLEDKNINAEVKISSNIEDINKSTHIILPGQGAFESCIKGLRKINGMIETLERNVLISKKPFLGICVGMQLLADQGYENGNNRGLGWIKGSIRKLNVKNQKLPHMGWNNVKIRNRNFEMNFSNDNKDFYFVHSYFFDCFDHKNIIGTTDYEINFPSIIGKENIYGVQFHPEKSSTQGLLLINNFLSL